MDLVTLPYFKVNVFHRMTVDGTSCTLTPEYSADNVLKYIRDFNVKETDVFVTSFPKSGTTWTQEIVYLLLNQDDFQGAITKPNYKRMPYFEQEIIRCEHELLRSLPDPRVIKMHLPFSLCPLMLQQGKGKVVYVARNPKDVIVSFYYFCQKIHLYDYSGSLEQFCKDFIEGRVAFGPWEDHVLSFWTKRENDNVLFIKYEDLQSDCHKVIHYIANFLNVSASAACVEKIVQHVSFDNMAKNKMTNYEIYNEERDDFKKDFVFMRKGQVGDWQNSFTREMSDAVDEYFSTHIGQSGLDFNFK